MSNEMQTFNLFPTPIWVRQLEPKRAEGINRQAIDLIERLRQETPGINPGDRWQTATNLETKPELQDLICQRRSKSTPLAGVKLHHWAT